MNAWTDEMFFTVFQGPFVMRFALDDPFVIDLAIIFGIGALGTMGVLAIAPFLRRRKR
jgi:hypothetical protein